MTHPHGDIALARRAYADVHLFQHHLARLDLAQRRLTASERSELERRSAAQAKEAMSLRRTLDQLGPDHQEALAREQALPQLNATLTRRLESSGPIPDSSNTTPRPSGPVLAGQRVLLVGGRPRALPGYRDFIESLGGRFTRHDGGVEQAINQLDPALTSASLVLCQTDCVSHVAYWQVKRHCRRAGKHCVFLEREGLNSLSAGLANVLAVTRPDVATTN